MPPIWQEIANIVGRGRVGKFILALGQDSMKSTLFTTGPYMDMLMDGLFVPEEKPDGSFVWANPACGFHPLFPGLPLPNGWLTSFCSERQQGSLDRPLRRWRLQSLGF
jgi:hypothetical protein